MNIQTSILDRIEITNDFNRKLNFNDNDIRKHFLELHSSILMNFFRGYVLVDIMEGFDKKELAFHENANKPLAKIFEVFKNDSHYYSYINSLHRRLFLDAFSNFDFCITTFCNAIIPATQRETLLNWKFNDLQPKLKEVNLGIQDAIQKKVKENHISHVPIDRRIRTLFKLAKKNYTRCQIHDKQFLEFIRRLRNTHHANFNYWGDKFEFNFGSAHYIFEDNKSVFWKDEYRDEIELNLDLVEEIRNIWIELINSIGFQENIPYIIDNEY